MLDKVSCPTPHHEESMSCVCVFSTSLSISMCFACMHVSIYPHVLTQLYPPMLLDFILTWKHVITDTFEGPIKLMLSGEFQSFHEIYTVLFKTLINVKGPNFIDSYYI